ncbi:MAG: cytochrome ubiquinol oxidase subunit I, partial [Holosporales bacterium]
EHLGYGLLLKRRVSDPAQATEADVLKAAEDTMPNVPLVFFCFRLMAGCGLFFLAFFVLSVFFSLQGTIAKREWLLKASLFSLPLPWIATSSGWIIAECGRQPWAIEGVLPTFYGASSLAPSSVWISLIGFIVLYSFLAVVDFFLMLKYARLGPDAALSPRH